MKRLLKKPAHKTMKRFCAALAAAALAASVLAGCGDGSESSGSGENGGSTQGSGSESGGGTGRDPESLVSQQSGGDRHHGKAAEGFCRRTS